MEISKIKKDNAKNKFNFNKDFQTINKKCYKKLR